MLSDTSFSDLILPPEGQALLKVGPTGCLTSCPEECLETVERLRSLSDATLDSGQDTFRLEHGGMRFRVTGLVGFRGVTFFLRRLPETIRPFRELGYPSPLANWLSDSTRQKGLVLFSGAQASGKTTSASSLIAARLAAFGGHAVTFENPVEMPLDGPHGPAGFCFQSELDSERDLAAAIEKAHRLASPPIIYIGEIRTKDAAVQVLRAALGSDRQLVVATIHGLDLISALDNLLTFARELDGDIAAHNLAQSLLAIVHQSLEIKNDQVELSVPEFLLLPFEEKSKGIRAQLRSSKLVSLENDIREQRNRLTFGGQI